MGTAFTIKSAFCILSPLIGPWASSSSIVRRSSSPAVSVQDLLSQTSPSSDNSPLQLSTAPELTAPAVNINLTQSTTTPWPAHWPFRTKAPFSQLQVQGQPPLDLPGLRDVMFTFQDPGRSCTYKSQKWLFDFAHQEFIRSWPRKAPPPWHTYEQHDRYFDHILSMKFVEVPHLEQQPNGLQLWLLAEYAASWLKRIYDLAGCRSSNVLFTARWQDLHTTILGTFKVDIKDPPTYDHDLTWPTVFDHAHLPLHLTIDGETHAGTYLEFSQPSFSGQRRGYWADPDPIGRAYAVQMLDAGIREVRARAARQQPGQVPTTFDKFTVRAMHIDYQAVLHTWEPKRGFVFWTVDFVIHVLVTLRDVIHRFGLIGVIVKVFDMSQAIGWIALGSQGPVSAVAPGVISNLTTF